MMENNKYFDFDAAMEERKNGDKPFIVKAFGEEHEIPNDVPFDLILTIQRAYKDGQNVMSDEQTIDMCHVIFGEETFNKWLKKGIGIKGIMLLTENVMSMYMADANKTSKRVAANKESKLSNP
jgi:hypothetical protein